MYTQCIGSKKKFKKVVDIQLFLLYTKDSYPAASRRSRNVGEIRGVETMKDLKIFTDNIEYTALDQVHTLLKQEAFSNSKVRIMPDVHAGKGCVIGFTADLGDRIIPNIVGVDIGCGMLTVQLGDQEIDLEKLDQTIRSKVPSGFKAHEYEQDGLAFKLEDLRVFDMLRNVSHIKKSLGTLGGGNHFIEIDIDDNGMKYLVIHTGSRNLGKQIADIYQKMAIYNMQKISEDDRQEIISKLKADGRQADIPDALRALTPKVKVPKDLAYLEGQLREDYLHDMKLCQKFAGQNRARIAQNIMVSMNLNFMQDGFFETVHNYIGDDNIVRKGAISAREGELVLIPINMRDGCMETKIGTTQHHTEQVD